MKTILRNLLTRGHPLEVKKQILLDLETMSEKEVCVKHSVTRSTLKRLVEFKKELLEANSIEKKKRIRSKEYMAKYKEKHYPKNKRKKHPFQVIARYANSNYKLICYRNKIDFKSEDVLTPLDLWAVAKKQRCRCALSGEPLTPETVSVDHIVHVSRGGANRRPNIRLVSSAVNKMRNDMSDEELIEICRKIAEHNAKAN